jgi:hypothetical protein
MGEICDRTQEHLGTSDTAIIAVRSDAVLIPAATSWLEATAERRKVLAGVNPDCA